MLRHPTLSCGVLVCLLLSGCLVSPVERSGGPGSITIPNTNIRAVADASRKAFARYGYRPAPSNMPHWIAFERPAGRTGEIMFGGWMHGGTAIRVRLNLVPIPGTSDIRIMPSVRRVSNAGRPGFERETTMALRSWAAQLRPVLQDVQSRAANAGPR
ncbi:MAG: hypothetical protein IAE97_11505 [Chthoniobacterales bacterium]|nr:hypothetical protein [Chthoniobacterales bacterium]